jgi:hypothetical protein
LNRAAFGHADRSRARCREIFGGAFCHASSPLLRRAGVNDRRRRNVTSADSSHPSPFRGTSAIRHSWGCCRCWFPRSTAFLRWE